MCHMIFDVNMGENFRIKSQFVADGHDPQTPEAMTCSSVVSRDSLWIAMNIAALNDLNILTYDIQNSYITTECIEYLWIESGTVFG